MKHWMPAGFVCLATLCLMFGGVAAPAAEDALLGETTLDDWQLLEPVNALGPIDPNGTWSQDGEAILATGTAAPWTIRTAGDADWTDYALAATVTIRKPAPKADFPIIAAEFDRYLPRDMFPPLAQHTGQYRYRYYAGEFDWGSDAALFVRHRNREQCYRVQLSTEYQELILWHGTGGYLQVVPCELTPGTAYRVEVRARGQNIQVWLDGQEKIDYWHRTLPTLAGQVGLGAYRATVAFQDVTVTALPPAETIVPPHQPRFHTRRWRTLRWIFDGDEPICLMEKDPRAELKGQDSGRLCYHQVKLVPGYRPYYFAWIGVQPGYGASMTWLAGDEDDIRTEGEGTDTLTLRLEGEDRDKYVHASTTDVLTFDRVRGTYRHTFTTEVEFLKDRTIGTFEFFDPLTYNNKEPGRGVTTRWLPAGHKWGLLRDPEGRVWRHPISQTLTQRNQNNWHLKGDNHFWMLYPDRAAAPVFEHAFPGETMEMGVCHWGYDWHQRVRFMGEKNNRHDFKAGDRKTFHYVATAYPPKEAEQLFLASKLHPTHEKLEPYPPKVLERLGQRLAPDGFVIPVCDPAGTDFTRVANIREPFVGWPWLGQYRWDRTEGHGDRYAIRLDGPAEANGTFYHHMIDPADRYLCTFWLKGIGITGEGPMVKLKYSFGDTPCDVVETNLTGSTEWKRYSFVTTVPRPVFPNYDSSTFIVSVEGSGQLWLDDFSVRPLAKGEEVADQLPEGAKVTRIPYTKKKD